MSKEKAKKLKTLEESKIMWNKWIDETFINKINESNIDTEKFMEKVEQDIFNAFRIPEELLKESSYSSVSCANFQLDNFNKTMEKINKLPPICTELEVYPQGYNAIKDNMIDVNILEGELHNRDKLSDSTGYRCPLGGIKIIVVYDNENFKYNQGRFIFNDGSSKIIDIFKGEE